jgi:hypothetical protein
MHRSATVWIFLSESLVDRALCAVYRRSRSTSSIVAISLPEARRLGAWADGIVESQLHGTRSLADAQGRGPRVRGLFMRLLLPRGTRW